MKTSSLLLLLLLLAAVPAVAADRSFELTGWAAWVDTNSNGTFNSTSPNQPFDIRFDGKLGYGAGANIFFGSNLSASFDVAQVKLDPLVRSRAVGGAAFTGSGLRMTPITAVLQWHFIPKGFIDPYIGAGAAYVLFDNVRGVGNISASEINFKDDAGLALNGGIAFAVSPNFAITVDGKYVPVKSSATAVYTNGTSTLARVKMNPVVFSGGLSWRF